MKEKLPVVIEDMELPEDRFKKKDEMDAAKGYVKSVLLVGLVCATWSIAAILFLLNRWIR